MRALITGAAFIGATAYAANYGGWEFGVPVFIIGAVITAAAHCYDRAQAEYAEFDGGYDDSVG